MVIFPRPATSVELTDSFLEMLIVRWLRDCVEMTAESAESEGNSEEENMSVQDETSTQPMEEMPAAEAPEVGGETTPAQPPAGGRRAQLKIVRESVESLSKDVGNLRKSSEASAKRLEAHMKSLRKELAAHTRSKDLGEHVKSHRADTIRLEKQLTTLRKDLASFKSQIAKDAAKSRAREEAALTKFAAKVKGARPKKPRAKPSKKKR